MSSDDVSSSSAASPTRAVLPVWLIPAILGAVLLAYLPTLRSGFIWDDDAHVTAPALRSLHGLWRIWFEPGATQQYYPLLHSLFWLQQKLWGGAPLGYHLVNLIVHATNAILVATLLRRLRIPGPELAAVVFALHPVHVESVAWISEQKNTISTLFYLGAALAYFRFDEERGFAAGTGDTAVSRSAEPAHPLATDRWYLISTALFVAALLTKSVTATLPAALVVVAWWRRGSVTWARELRPVVPWLVLALASGCVTAYVEHSIVGAKGPDFDLSAADRFLIAGRAVWFYLGELFWPAKLVFIHPRWSLDPRAAQQWLPLLAGALVLGTLWRVRRQSRGPLAGALFFVGTLAPALGFVNVFPFIYSFVADHFQYVASLGPITLACAGAALATGGLGRRTRLASAVLVIGALGAVTWRGTLKYRDADTLYLTTLEQNPDCWMAANNLGKDLMVVPARLPEAIRLFQRALLLHPNYPEAENNLGLALTQMGRAAEAIPHLERATTMKTAFYQAYNNLGIAYARTNQLEKAVGAFSRAAALAPLVPNVEENLAKTLRALGRHQEAEQHFERAAALRAQAAAAH